MLDFGGVYLYLVLTNKNGKLEICAKLQILKNNCSADSQVAKLL